MFYFITIVPKTTKNDLAAFLCTHNTTQFKQNKVKKKKQIL